MRFGFIKMDKNNVVGRQVSVTFKDIFNYSVLLNSYLLSMCNLFSRGPCLGSFIFEKRNIIENSVQIIHGTAFVSFFNDQRSRARTLHYHKTIHSISAFQIV